MKNRIGVATNNETAIIDKRRKYLSLFFCQFMKYSDSST